MDLSNKQFSEKAKKDFQLIELAKERGDEKAYAELMQRYKKPVYHMILKMVRNVDDAEDLTIEAFAKAFKNLKNSILSLHSVHGFSGLLPITVSILFARKSLIPLVSVTLSRMTMETMLILT